jgi:hypothetical protein
MYDRDLLLYVSASDRCHELTQPDQTTLADGQVVSTAWTPSFVASVTSPTAVVPAGT